MNSIANVGRRLVYWLDAFLKPSFEAALSDRAGSIARFCYIGRECSFVYCCSLPACSFQFHR